MKRGYTVVYFLCFLLFFSVSAFSQEIQTVVCSGTGKNQAEAEKAALRSAVEQAVGALVDADTLIQNDEIVSNQVISYSDGFVEKWEPVGEPKTDRNGVVTIKIKAQVKRNKLVEKLKEAKITVKEIDGQSLFGEAVSKIEGRQNSLESIKKVFESVPESLINAEVIDKKIIKEGDPTTVALEIEVQFDWETYSKNFLPRFLEVLDQICEEKGQSPLITDSVKDDDVWGFRSNYFSDLENAIDSKASDTTKKKMFFVNIRRDKAGGKLNWNWYLLPEDVIKFIETDIYSRFASIRLQYYGKDDEILIEDELKNGEQYFSLFVPRLGHSFIVCPSILRDNFHLNSRVYTQNATFSLDELRALSKIKCFAAPISFKNGRLPNPF